MKCRRIEDNNIVWFKKKFSLSKSDKIYLNDKLYYNDEGDILFTPQQNNINTFFINSISDVLPLIKKVDNVIYNHTSPSDTNDGELNKIYFYFSDGQLNVLCPSVFEYLKDEYGNSYSGTATYDTILQRNVKYYGYESSQMTSEFIIKEGVQYYSLPYSTYNEQGVQIGNTFLKVDNRQHILSFLDKSQIYIIIDNAEYYVQDATKLDNLKAMHKYGKLYVLPDVQYYEVTKESISNYSEGKAGVADSISQRLSVIKGELWYDINEGLPLFDENKSSITMDSYILSVLNKHPDVIAVVNFESKVDNKVYSCSFEVQTKYGNIILEM